MKYLILALLLIPLTAQAAVKLSHMESNPMGWRMLYYSKNDPVVVFVPRCTETMVMDCAWNKTTAKALGKKLAETKK